MHKYVYHCVPKNLVGNKLYPLNKLRDMIPEAYDFQVKKYNGRTDVMNLVIPHLNCLWNDVLHFLPFHPNKIYKSLVEFFPDISERPNYEFFKIPISDLDTSKAALFLFTSEKDRNYDENICAPYDSFRMTCETDVSEVQAKYYREKMELGEKPLLFARTTHFLLNDEIDICDVEKVFWR